MSYAFSLLLNRSPDAAAHGAHGLIDHLLGALADRGTELDRDLALVLTGAAFRTYQFVPADNWGWGVEHPEERWRWQTLDVENYGVIEAISAHASADIRRWDVGAKVASWLQVVQVEHGAGRGLLARVPGEPASFWRCDRSEFASKPQGVSGPGIPPREQTGQTRRVEIADLTATLEPPFPLETLITVRPSPTPTPPERLPALWKDVLVFATRHATSKKELAHHEELFYASGVRAWHMTAELVAGDAPGLAEYWAAWRAQMVEARAAAGRGLRRFPDVPGAFDAPADCLERLHAAASTYAEVAEQVAALPDVPGAVASHAIDAIVAAEVRAVAELTLALRALP